MLKIKVVLASFVLLVVTMSCATGQPSSPSPYERSTEEQIRNFKAVDLPFPVGVEFTVSQGAFGKASHNEPGNEYSWDFDVPFGTPVTAVEAGRVIEVWHPDQGGGCEPKYSAAAHNIKVEHADGTVAQYVHVDSIVEVGQEVRRGEIIAVTGNNGWICQPQLHFGVYASKSELYSSPKRKTIPVQFRGLPNGLAVTGLRVAVPKYAPDDSQSEMVHSFLAHPLDKSKRIEIYWLKPAGVGPWPLVIEIHGHQEPERPGAANGFGWFEKMAKAGYIGAGVSQPGYGRSDGPPDYCGPFTQAAVQEVIKYFRAMPIVRSDKVALYGMSRGAVVASMVATKEQSLAAVVLNVGVYDMKTSYEKFLKSKDTVDIAENIKREAGTSDAAFLERSALKHVDQIKTPALIMTDSARQAELLAEELNKHGVPAKFKKFLGFGHFIPNKLRNTEIDPFLKRYLSQP